MRGLRFYFTRKRQSQPASVSWALGEDTRHLGFRQKTVSLVTAITGRIKACAHASRLIASSYRVTGDRPGDTCTWRSLPNLGGLSYVCLIFVLEGMFCLLDTQTINDSPKIRTVCDSKYKWLRENGPPTKWWRLLQNEQYNYLWVTIFFRIFMLRKTLSTQCVFLWFLNPLIAWPVRLSKAQPTQAGQPGQDITQVLSWDTFSSSPATNSAFSAAKTWFCHWFSFLVTDLTILVATEPALWSKS